MTAIKPTISRALLFLFLCIILGFALKAPSSSQEVPADSYAVFDMTGKPVYLRQPVQRGMVFAPVADHFITVDDSADRLIALAAYIKQETAHNMLGRIFPDLPYKQEALTVNVTQPVSVEQSLLLNADMVLVNAYQAEAFDAAGLGGTARITSLYARESEMFDMLGGLTGQTKRVNDLFLRQKVLLDKLFAAVPQNKTPVTMLTVSHHRFHLFPSLFENYNANLKRCNAVNLAQKAVFPGGSINIEALLQYNPDVIFLYDYRNLLTVRDVYANRALKGLSAVQNRRVYRMPTGIARMTGPVDEPLLFYWMCQLLHPEMMLPLTFRSLVKNTYFEVFGYRPTEKDIDDMLNMCENTSSAGYERFAYNGSGL